MPSGWSEYYVVFLSAVLAVVIPLALVLLSKVLGTAKNTENEARTEASKAPAPMDQSEIGRRMNTRFFLGANTALILTTLLLALIPCAGTIKLASSHDGVLKGLLSIVTFAGFAILGLLYSMKKKDLDWLRSFRRDDTR